MPLTIDDEGAIILILRPTDRFDIVTAELKRVASLRQYMMVEGAVRSDRMDAGQENLRQLATLCEHLLPSQLYQKYANKKLFRHEKDFWATTETVVRTYVKRMADAHLVKAVKQAASIGIPVLYAPSEKSPLHISDALQLEDGQEVTPVMTFRRHDDGTSYQLQLRIGERLTESLHDKQLVVLAYEPGMFVLDGHIYLLNSDFSGKLLLPFIKKPQVEIPRKMENDYFRRFILKHVARAEIHAEGFDITDISLQPRPCLALSTCIDDSRVASLRFSYGNTEYWPYSKTNGRVTLTEEDGNFRFIRQMRDKQAEEVLLCRLAEETRQGAADAEAGHACAYNPARGELRFQSLALMVSWLRLHAPSLKAQGFDVVQPFNEVYYIGPLSVEQSDKWNGDWLQTDVTVVADDGRLRFPFHELRDTILRGEQEYMLPTGELLLIPQEWLQRYSDLLLIGLPKGQGFQRHRSQILSSGEAVANSPLSTLHSPLEEAVANSPLSTLHSPLEEAVANSPLSTLHSPLEEAVANSPLSTLHSPLEEAVANSQLSTLHSQLKCTLRPYQITGFQWLWHNFMAQTGCCLSDEMGLGKTLQTIALLLNYKLTTKSAQAAHQPKPGMLFSDEEMQGEGGDSQLTLHHSQLQFRTSLVVAPASVVHNWRNELQRFAPSLLVQTYTGDTAKRQNKRQALMRWDVVLTTYRTLLNDIDFLAQQQFGIIVFDESQAFKTATSQIHHAVSRLNALHRMALSGTPVENNLGELWSLMNVLNPCLLGDAQTFQRSFVNPIASQMEASRRDLLRRLIAPYFLKRTKEEVLSDLPERQDEVIVCPMTDEQASNYATELSKARNEWLDPNSKVQNRQINMLAALQRLRQVANGKGKLAVVFERLENLRQTRHKVLIFSEYVTLLERVGDEMAKRGWTYDLLTGKTQQREQVIEHFQQEADCQFFLISLKAGGVGLNLTAADYVFILDPWWNHAAEEQAIARAHRIGQHRAVFVYRFVAADTLEEQILSLQDRKQTLIDSVMPFICP